jgi:hypothetical protein
LIQASLWYKHCIQIQYHIFGALSMNLTIKSPLQFSATQKAKQPDINNPQNKADFTALLKVAKPCAQYLGDFQSASIIVEENNLLVVSPAMSSQPIGGGATDYLFNQDGSVSRR